MKIMKMSVYVIKNLINGRVYVGSSSNSYKRELRHKSELRKGHHYNGELQDDYNKYGMNAFVFEILEEISEKEKLLIREMFWINQLQSINSKFGYNKMPSIAGEVQNRDTKQKNEGERNKRATISAKDVIDICKRLNCGESVISIKRHYGIVHETVYRIIRGERWRDLGEVYLSHEILSKWKVKSNEKGIHPDSVALKDLESICDGINQNISDKELAITYGLSESGISVIRKGGCRSAETINLLNDDVLSLWTYNIHLVKHLMPKKEIRQPLIDKLKGTQVLTNTQVKEICESLNNGVKPNEIADRYGVNSETIYRLRKGHYYKKITDKYLCDEIIKNRNKVNKGINALSDDKVIKICEMINSGTAISNIATEMDVVKSTIYRIRNGENNRTIGNKYLSNEVTARWKY